MAQLAEGHVSRAFISQLESGAARPSAEILELIASRTGKPISYFTTPGSDQRLVRQQLAVELATAAAKLKRVRETRKLDIAQREMLKTLEFSLRRGAVLLRSLDPSTRLTGQR